jgi:hypothetical protein
VNSKAEDLMCFGMKCSGNIDILAKNLDITDIRAAGPACGRKSAGWGGRFAC